MPIGKYERKAHMKTYGRTRSMRPQVLELKAQGKSTLEIARELEIDTSTVKRLNRAGAEGDVQWGNKSKRKAAE